VVEADAEVLTGPEVLVGDVLLDAGGELEEELRAELEAELATELLDAADADDEADEAVPAAAQSALAALRTDNASVAPQAESTQGVAAFWRAAAFSGVHWQTRSVAPHLVDEATASARHLVAHAGIAADVKPTSAMMARAEYEYFILRLGLP